MALNNIHITTDKKLENDLERVNFPDGVVLAVREIEILKLIAEGYENKEIAQKLYISIHTVKSHIEYILRTLNARNRANSVFIAKNMNII